MDRLFVRRTALLLAFILTFTAAAEVLIEGNALAATKKVKISDKRVRRFFSHSCFIGNSVMVGRMSYVKNYARKYMRYSTPLARVSWSFSNDRNKNHGFMIQYKGVEMQAKYAVKKCGKMNVFIGTGTNDLFGGVRSTFEKYKSFVYGIKKVNKKATIYIESMTPIWRGKGALNNKNIKALNKKLRKYAKTHKRVYFIPVSQALRDSHGRLRASYCSDRYVHMTAAGYKKWNDQTIQWVKKMLRLKKAKKWDYLRGGRKKVIKKKKKTDPKKVKVKRIVRWDKTKKKLYWNTGWTVKRVAFFKRRFYAFTKEGKYRPKFTKKLRAAMKFGKDVTALRKLLGKPKKSIYKASCYDPDGNGKDGILTYKLFKLLTYKDADGKEILLDCESRY